MTPQNQLRPFKFTRNFTQNPLSSVLVEMGQTRVLCTVSLEDRVPPFLRDSGQGWLTAEYAMLPGSSEQRIRRETSKPSGRSSEIQRLIGRSLRAALDLEKLGEQSLFIDCDVIQADGGTRTASITGGMLALYDACLKLKSNGKLKAWPIKYWIAAVSVGVVKQQVCLDLCYEQDSQADVDFNVIQNEFGDFIELQGTAEKLAFSHNQLNEMLTSASDGISNLIAAMKQEIGTT